MRCAAILTGGRARRFAGRDKGALRVGAHTILAREMAVLADAGITAVAHVGRPGQVPPPGTTLLVDAMPGTGALGGVYTALLAAPADHVLVVACDMPFLTVPLIDALFDRVGEKDAAVPRTGRGWHPLAGVYHRRVAARLRQRLVSGRLRVVDALDDLDVRAIGPDELAVIDPTGMSLVNVNTPDDYQRACGVIPAHEQDGART